ncbi:MAG: ATPase, partial [Ectothiorhodospiraceae bacterium]|nr:ATPase [Ectothiorhodospiraceae bacterium]
MPSPLVLIGGDSYRVGQIGAFVRIPLGYSQLYAVCAQVGADAAPAASTDLSATITLESRQDQLSGFRWMSVVLFGEGVANEFQRGVGQYPTVGDEVHLVTNDDLATIYGHASEEKGVVTIGKIAGSSGVPASIDIAGLVTRHSVVVGSTGSGKSNLVTVLLESVSGGELPTARTIVIDPHGEYASAVGDQARLFRTKPDEAAGEHQLRVPFWALPFSHLQELVLGPIQPNHEASIREEVLKLKADAATHLATTPPTESLTADSPVPFSIKKLWHDLDNWERMTFSQSQNQNEGNRETPTQEGDPSSLKPTLYPASNYNAAPFLNKSRRNITRQLAFMASRIRDSRFAFLFSPGGGYDPTLDGKVENDLDKLVSDWVGHDRPITIFDVSGVPSEVRPTI